MRITGSTSHFPYVVGPEYRLQGVINTGILRLAPTTPHFIGSDENSRLLVESYIHFCPLESPSTT